MVRKEKSMKELLELYDEVVKIADDIKFKDKDNPYYEAYNMGVDAMMVQIRHHINTIGLVKAFGGEQKWQSKS
jgi:hypothetical protein